jgi:predicted RNA polymerase sigma factor
VTIDGPGAVSKGVNAATSSLDVPRLMTARPIFADVAAEQLDAVYRYLVYLTGDRGAAEDLTAETFEKAFRSWRRFDPRRGSPRTWLCRIARSVAVDWPCAFCSSSTARVQHACSGSARPLAPRGSAAHCEDLRRG